MQHKKNLFAVLFVVLFCVSFVFLFMYFQSQRQIAAEEPPIKKEIPLPEISFSDANDNKLPEDEIRTGKVVLIFLMTDCHHCQSEAEFLNQLAAKRKDIKFYGIISLGDKKKQLEIASTKYPMPVVYDDSRLFAKYKYKPGSD